MEGEPTQDPLIHQLRHLRGLTIAGLVTPSVANSVTRNLQIDLNEQFRRNQQRGEPTLASPDVLAACRANPALIKLFEPFLTDEQIRALSLEVGDDPATE